MTEVVSNLMIMEVADSTIEEEAVATEEEVSHQMIVMTIEVVLTDEVAAVVVIEDFLEDLHLTSHEVDPLQETDVVEATTTTAAMTEETLLVKVETHVRMLQETEEVTNHNNNNFNNSNNNHNNLLVQLQLENQVVLIKEKKGGLSSF